MPTLRELQVEFSAAIFSGDGESFSRHLVSEGLNPQRRVDIYRNNVFGTLTDSLKIAYPVIHQLVGEKFFEHLASQFIHQTPSHSGNLQNFGAEMAEFISNLQEAAQLPYLPDVARLEWACHEVFFAADHLPLEGNRLAGVPEDRYGELKFHLNPATRLITSEYPIHLIWESNQERFQGHPEIDLDQGGIALMVIRKNYQAVLKPITKAEIVFLTAFRNGCDLSSASDASLAMDSDFDVATVFQGFVADVVLVDFSL